MFETYTYDYILKRMLDRVSDSIDKREGSVIHSALAPMAAELAQAYIDMDIFLGLAFANTASGTYLEQRTAEMGIERQQATKARRKGLFHGSGSVLMDVPINSRFSIDGLNYKAISKISTGTFTLECETAGTAGNSPIGSLLPIDYIAGLVEAQITDVISEGMDAETDERLLDRYLLRVRQPVTSGNSYQYRQWAMEVPGVGDAKIFPLWDGAGTVKVVIMDIDKQPASSGLVDETAEYIEQVRPIGAAVTVVSGTGKDIDVQAEVYLADGYTIETVTEAFTQGLAEYLKSAAFASTYISYAKIGTILLSSVGVLDYDNLLVCGDTANVPLTVDEVGVVGTIALEVADG